MTDKLNAAKGNEVKGFLFLSIVVAPALSIALVGGYGFSIWIYQLLVGPPGAP